MNETSSTIPVNLYGLLGEQDGTQLDIASHLLVEGGQFVYDNVTYEIVRVILEDVEHPIVYVVILDVLNQS